MLSDQLYNYSTLGLGRIFQSDRPALDKHCKRNFPAQQPTFISGMSTIFNQRENIQKMSIDENWFGIRSAMSKWLDGMWLIIEMWPLFSAWNNSFSLATRWSLNKMENHQRATEWLSINFAAFQQNGSGRRERMKDADAFLEAAREKDEWCRWKVAHLNAI